MPRDLLAPDLLAPDFLTADPLAPDFLTAGLPAPDLLVQEPRARGGAPLGGVIAHRAAPG